ncbi:hypothetical protein D3C75_844870 [compost metagenome]
MIIGACFEIFQVRVHKPAVSGSLSRQLIELRKKSLGFIQAVQHKIGIEEHFQGAFGWICLVILIPLQQLLLPILTSFCGVWSILITLELIRGK